MYSCTSYTPKISKSLLGEEISTSHGLTQGRSSSANLFSSFVSDLCNEFNTETRNEFMDIYYLFQLADDIAITAEFLDTLKEKILATLRYSDRKYLSINLSKTVYLHLSDTPVSTPLVFESDHVIESVDDNKSHNWLGFQLCQTNSIKKLIKLNINSKMFNIAKYAEWLDINESTPFYVKLSVLYSCVIPSILYSIEAWGNVATFEAEVLLIERKCLKKCLGVKSGTNNDLIYIEVNRSDIVSHIKDRQFKFFRNVSSLSIDESIVKGIIDVYNNYLKNSDSSIIKYYSTLDGKERKRNNSQRRNYVNASERSSDIRYREIIGCTFNRILYKSDLNDEDRIVITRWRLSNHNLKIEKGRYTKPFTERECRLCVVCNVLEDEEHALFYCKVHSDVRIKFNSIISRYTSVRDILNPKSITDAHQIASYLRIIENNLNLLYDYNSAK